VRHQGPIFLAFDVPFQFFVGTRQPSGKNNDNDTKMMGGIWSFKKCNRRKTSLEFQFLWNGSISQSKKSKTVGLAKTALLFLSHKVLNLLFTTLKTDSTNKYYYKAP